MFIDPNARVPISDDEGNTIFIKAKMDIATDTAVTVEFARINSGTGFRAQKAYELALLYHNIVAWEGPAFKRPVLSKAGTPMLKNGAPVTKPIPCTRQAIGSLDPFAPLVARVLAAIDEQNREVLAEPDPKKLTSQSASDAAAT